jgi:hypothetical protein
MYRVAFILAVVLGFCYSSPRSREKRSWDDANSGLLYGGGYSFILSAPEGWVLDSTSGKSQGMVAVFYPNVVSKGPGKETISQIINIDISDFARGSADSTAVDEDPVQTRDKNKAAVKRFHDAQNHNDEAVAYIDEAKVIVIVALSSRNKDQFDKSLDSFRDLVGSYYFLAEKTVVQHIQH